MSSEYRQGTAGTTRARTQLRLRGRVACAGAFAVLLAALAILSQPAGSATAAAAQGKDPGNVIVVLSDDQPLRTAELMPFLSKSGWASFDNSIVNNPLCCPSRTTILTGLYSNHTGVEDNTEGAQFDDSDTLATWLDDAGYRTGLLGKYLNEYPFGKNQRYIPPGWDKWAVIRGKPGFYDYKLNVDGKLERKGDKKRNYIGRFLQRETMRFLRPTKSDDPFFLFVSHYAPHSPAIADPRDEGKFKKLPVRMPPSFNEKDVSDKPTWIQGLEKLPRRQVVRDYRKRAESALSVDRLLRNTVKKLKRTDQLDDTTIIFLSDHGYSLGEHRYKSKNCEFEECLRVPLRILTPGVPKGSSYTEPVSNTDLAPTIADLANVTPPDDRDGKSLLPLMTRRRPERDRTILLQNELGPPIAVTPRFWGVRTRDYKYIELETGERELYDLANDPFELENQADDPDYAEIQAALKDQLQELRKNGGWGPGLAAEPGDSSKGATGDTVGSDSDNPGDSGSGSD